MKLGKMAWVILVVGIIVIAGGSLGMTHSRQSQEQRQLEKTLAESTRKLASLDNSALERKVSELAGETNSYTAKIESAKASLSSPEDNISASDILLKASRNTKLVLTVLSSPGLSEAELAGTECRTLAMGVEARGDIFDIRTFVDNLNQLFPTVIVQNVAISNTIEESQETMGGGEETLPQDTQMELSDVSTATISLIIYDYVAANPREGN